MMFKQQMGILDWFVKDHVTLKSNDYENSDFDLNLWSQEYKLHLKIEYNRKQLQFSTSQCYCFTLF